MTFHESKGQSGLRTLPDSVQRFLYQTALVSCVSISCLGSAGLVCFFSDLDIYSLKKVVLHAKNVYNII